MDAVCETYPTGSEGEGSEGGGPRRILLFDPERRRSVMRLQVDENDKLIKTVCLLATVPIPLENGSTKTTNPLKRPQKI